jgi:Holliday junction DNA helicase RuvA
LIVGLKGSIESLESNSIYLDVNGVIYEVFMTLPDLEGVEEKREVSIHIHQIFREDSVELFGFLERSGKNLFRELIKISGVGSKVAMAILSTISGSELLQIIENGDEKALTKVPKIGAKSAKKILTELTFIKDRLDISGDSVSSEKSIAIQALEQLGFNRKDILSAVDGVSSENHSDIIREALQKLAK